MKEKLRTINVLNHVFSIPQTAVYNLRAIDAVYECGTVDHDLHISTDELELEHIIALFDAVIEGDRISALNRLAAELDPPAAASVHEIAMDAVKEGLKKYDEARAAARPSDDAYGDIDVFRLALHPGDTIVVTPRDDLSDTARQRLAADVLAATGHQHKVLILGPGTMISTMGVDVAEPISFANLASAKAGAEIPLSPGDGAERAAAAEPKPEPTREEAVAEFRANAQRLANEILGEMKKAAAAGIPKEITEIIWYVASGMAK